MKSVKFFFSQNLDLIEHKLNEWTGEKYKLRWASSFNWGFIIRMSFVHYTMFWVIESLLFSDKRVINLLYHDKNKLHCFVLDEHA